MRKIISTNRRVIDPRIKQALAEKNIPRVIQQPVVPVVPTSNMARVIQPPPPPPPPNVQVSQNQRPIVRVVPAPPPPAQVSYQHPMRDDTILITGGIGDFIALESFFSDDLRERLTTICYATNKQHQIEDLMRAVPNYPKLEKHVVVWHPNDFKDFWCFITKNDCAYRIREKGLESPVEFQQAMDYGIFCMFNRGLPYAYSSFIKYNIANITEFQLPDNYIFIAPCSTDKRIGARDFSTADWNVIQNYLTKTGTYGVVVNQGKDFVPIHEKLIDLSNKTTITEAVEILKKANGYIGIDSCMSVLAAKLFGPQRLLIKTNNHHCKSFLNDYFAPQTAFNIFVKSAVDLTNFH